MDEGTQTQTKREITAREWFFWLAVGLVMAAVGLSSDYTVLVPVGLLLAAACGFGLVWRLLGKR